MLSAKGGKDPLNQDADLAQPLANGTDANTGNSEAASSSDAQVEPASYAAATAAGTGAPAASNDTAGATNIALEDSELQDRSSAGDMQMNQPCLAAVPAAGQVAQLAPAPGQSAQDEGATGGTSAKTVTDVQANTLGAKLAATEDGATTTSTTHPEGAYGGAAKNAPIAFGPKEVVGADLQRPTGRLASSPGFPRRYVQPSCGSDSELYQSEKSLEERVRKLKRENKNLKEKVGYLEGMVHNLRTDVGHLQQQVSIQHLQFMQQLAAMEKRQHEGQMELQKQISKLQITNEDHVDKMRADLDAANRREMEQKKQTDLHLQRIHSLQEEMSALEADNRTLRNKVGIYEQQLGIRTDDGETGQLQSSIPETQVGVHRSGFRLLVPEQGTEPNNDQQRLQDIAEIQGAIVRHVGEGETLLKHTPVAEVGQVLLCAVLGQIPAPVCVARSQSQSACPTSTADGSTASACSSACQACRNGGVACVPIVHARAADTAIGQSLGLTAEWLEHPSNLVCMHMQVARYFCRGLIAMVPDWDPATQRVCSPLCLRVVVLDQQIFIQSIKKNPECLQADWEAIPLDGQTQSTLRVANLHGRVLHVTAENLSWLDLLAINLWFVFRSAVECQRPLPVFDPASGRFGEDFAEVTSELLEHMFALCMALFSMSPGRDSQHRANFVKAMYMNNALDIVKQR